MLEKSVAILGKGPSVSRCTKEFIDSFDEVAACGRPVFLGYEHLIGNKAKYDFANRTAEVFLKSIEEKCIPTLSEILFHPFSTDDFVILLKS